MPNKLLPLPQTFFRSNNATFQGMQIWSVHLEVSWNFWRSDQPPYGECSSLTAGRERGRTCDGEVLSDCDCGS